MRLFIIIWSLISFDLLVLGWLAPMTISSKLPSEVLTGIVFIGVPSCLAVNIVVVKFLIQQFIKGNHNEKVS